MGDDLEKELCDLRRIRNVADTADKGSKENKEKQARDKKMNKDFNWTKLHYILSCRNCNTPC